MELEVHSKQTTYTTIIKFTFYLLNFVVNFSTVCRYLSRHKSSFRHHLRAEEQQQRPSIPNGHRWKIHTDRTICKQDSLNQSKKNIKSKSDNISWTRLQRILHQLWFSSLEDRLQALMSTHSSCSKLSFNIQQTICKFTCLQHSSLNKVFSISYINTLTNYSIFCISFIEIQY